MGKYACVDSNPEKWRDPWFMELSIRAKVLFWFLYENCDIAGFYERNDKLTAASTGLGFGEIVEAYQELEKSIIIRDRWVLVKNFLKHQHNLPLNPENNCHVGIIRRINEKNGLFDDVYKSLNINVPQEIGGATQPLPRGTGKGKGKGKGSVFKSLSLKEDKGGVGEKGENRIEALSAVSPQAEFVQKFKETYESLVGQPFKIKKQHYIIAAALLRDYPLQIVHFKAGLLAGFCQKKSTWFTKGGWADFSIETLSRHWNSIIPEAKEETPIEKQAKIDAEIREQRRIKHEQLKADMARK